MPPAAMTTGSLPSAGPRFSVHSRSSLKAIEPPVYSASTDDDTAFVPGPECVVRDSSRWRSIGRLGHLIRIPVDNGRSLPPGNDLKGILHVSDAVLTARSRS